MTLCLLLPSRSLPIALAHVIANAKPGRDQAKLEACNRIFASLNPWQQTICRVEIADTRAAKRGELLAMVS